MRLLTTLAVLLPLAFSQMMFGQNAVDSIFVEVYHVEQGGTGQPPVKTYRIYVDLAPDHELQMVYGDEQHPLVIHTTTSFVNDTAFGGEFGSKVRSENLNSSQAALDSWITMVLACDSFAGVPRSLDTDGSMLKCPPYQAKGSSHHAAHDPTPSLCKKDGLIPAPEPRAIVPFNLTTSYMGRVRGNLMETTNGAWAVPGGMKGVTDRNLFLIGQFTTSGDLAFRINIQVETPQHEAVKYVWRDPGPGEFLAKGSANGTYLRQAPPSY